MLNRYGHLYSDELDSLAERLGALHERARSATETDRMRTEHAPRRGPDRKSRRSLTCGFSGHDIPDREVEGPTVRLSEPVPASANGRRRSADAPARVSRPR